MSIYNRGEYIKRDALERLFVKVSWAALAILRWCAEYGQVPFSEIGLSGFVGDFPGVVLRQVVAELLNVLCGEADGDVRRIGEECADVQSGVLLAADDEGQLVLNQQVALEENLSEGINLHVLADDIRAAVRLIGQLPPKGAGLALIVGDDHLDGIVGAVGDVTQELAPGHRGRSQRSVLLILADKVGIIIYYLCYSVNYTTEVTFWIYHLANINRDKFARLHITDDIIAELHAMEFFNSVA